MCADFSEGNSTKDWFREEVLEVVRGSASLLWDEARGKLRYHVAGLAGVDAPELQMHKRYGTLNPAMFIGL